MSCGDLGKAMPEVWQHPFFAQVEIKQDSWIGRMVTGAIFLTVKLADSVGYGSSRTLMQTICLEIDC
jgi:hypothetical protein